MRYIDADEIKWERHELMPGWYSMNERSYYLTVNKERVDTIPTADVEPVRHGYWHEVIPNTNGRNGDYECSVCGEAVVVKYPNCPYCCAKMDGKEEENG